MHLHNAIFAPQRDNFLWIESYYVEVASILNRLRSHKAQCMLARVTDCSLALPTAPSRYRLLPRVTDCSLTSPTAASRYRLLPRVTDRSLASPTAPSRYRLLPHVTDCSLALPTAPYLPDLLDFRSTFPDQRSALACRDDHADGDGRLRKSRIVDIVDILQNDSKMWAGGGDKCPPPPRGDHKSPNISVGTIID